MFSKNRGNQNAQSRKEYGAEKLAAKLPGKNCLVSCFSVTLAALNGV